MKQCFFFPTQAFFPVYIAPLVQWFSVQGNFSPQGIFGNIWRQVWPSQFRDDIQVEAKDAAKTFCNAQDSPSQQIIIWPKMSIVLRLRNFFQLRTIKGRTQWQNCRSTLKPLITTIFPLYNQLKIKISIYALFYEKSSSLFLMLQAVCNNFHERLQKYHGCFFPKVTQAL